MHKYTRARRHCIFIHRQLRENASVLSAWLSGCKYADSERSFQVPYSQRLTDVWTLKDLFRSCGRGFPVMRKSLFYTSESTFSCRYNALPVYPKSPFHGVIVRISCAGTSQTVVRNGFYRFPALSFAISYCQNILLPYVYIYAVRKSLSLRVLIVDTFPSHRAIIINETFWGLHLVLFPVHDSHITTSLYIIIDISLVSWKSR